MAHEMITVRRDDIDNVLCWSSAGDVPDEDTLGRLHAAWKAGPAPAAEPTETQRCWSCDHPADDHDDDGCTRLIRCSLVTVEQADEPTFCPCASSAESARTPEQDAEQAGGDA